MPISTLLRNKKDSVSSCLIFVCFLYYIQKVDIAKLECLFRGVLVNKMVTDTYHHISNVIDLILLLSLHCLRALFMRWSQFIAMFSPFILLIWTWRGTRSFICIFGCNNSFIHLYRSTDSSKKTCYLHYLWLPVLLIIKINFILNILYSTFYILRMWREKKVSDN